MTEIIGIFQRTKKGFGFISHSGLDEDIFIPAKYTLSAMNGDVVRVNIKDTPEPSNLKKEGIITEIIERKTSKVVGVFLDYEEYAFVEPLDLKLTNDIFISKRGKRLLRPENGQIVVVDITKYPKENKKAEGFVSEILGYPDDKGIEILTIIKRFNINTEFDENIKKEVQSISQSVSEKETMDRLDLRDEIIFTIDGEDAKDLDDAVSIDILPNGNYHLGVHIADVTHYVREKSFLDKEAYSRATSIYLVDEVIPMLPRELSNGICSLNPSVDRLTLSCFMEIDKHGRVLKNKIVESVINTEARMNYSDVTKMLKDKDQELIDKYPLVYPKLMIMEKLQGILYKKRMNRGSLDFEFKESKITLDENRKPISIEAYERDISNRIIEEFMLVCNETVAEEMNKIEIPFVYRVHEKPKIDKFETLNEFMTALGEDAIKEEQLNPKYIQKIVHKYKGTEEEQVINTLILRSLMKAKYSPLCLNHFGLNADYYCHFTSPIRRYPDLQIHRIIKRVINNNIDSKYRKKLERRVEFTSIQSSERELVAQEAEKEVHKVKKAEFMLDKIGEVYEGVISGVTRFGAFVQLDNTVEGLVTLESFEDDAYVFDEAKFHIVGLVNKKIYKIGQKVKISVKNVDMKNKEIFFSIINEQN